MVRLWLISLMLVPCLCPAQVTGTFSMEKSVFAPGEPVYLSLTLRNEGKESEQVVTADPYSFCSGYSIRISRDPAPLAACFQSFGGSCISGTMSLAPGASRTERIVLNYQNESRGEAYVPVRQTGDYTVEASYTRPSPESSVGVQTHADVQKTFHLRVDADRTVAPTVYSALVLQLASTDPETRREAARVLATLAPPSLESLLLTFATSKDFAIAPFGPLALANLNTKASLAALAKMLLPHTASPYESAEAPYYLGKTHDPVWLPLLLEASDQHEGMYLAYAADSGGEAAIPALLARVRSGDARVRQAAVSALGQTGSRAAIPILIGLLGPHRSLGGGAEDDLERSAATALIWLTHVSADSGPVDDLALQTRWRQWWLASGSTAQAFEPGDCAPFTKLP